MQKQFGIILGLWCGLALFACRATKNELAIVDGEMEEPRLEPAEEISKLPTALWSPAQKRATAAYYFLVAEYADLIGNGHEANDYYQVSYTLDSNYVTAEKFLKSSMKSGDIEKSFELSRQFVLMYPKSWQIHFMHAQILARTGKSNDAIYHTEKAIALNPGFEHGYIQLVTLYHSEKAFAKAEEIVKKLIKQQPESVLGWSLLTRMHIENGNWQKARESSEKLYQLNSGNPEATLIYIYLSHLNGDSQKGIYLFDQLAKRQSTNEDWLARAVVLQRNFGDLENILEQFQKMTRLSEQEAIINLQIQQVFLLWELKKFEEASQLLDQILMKTPHTDQLLYLSAIGYERSGQLAQAKEAYEKIQPYTTFYLPAQFKISGLYLVNDQWDKALEVMLNLIHYRYTSWETYLQGASLYVLKEKYDSAIKLLTNGFEKFPKKIRLLFLKGVYQEKIGQIDKCIETMKEVIVKDPTHSSAYNYLGYLYAEQGNHLEEAEGLILKALELKPDDGYYLDSLGWVYFKQQKFEKALEVLNEALKFAPAEGIIMEHIAEVYLQLGYKDEAVKYMSEALKYLKEENDKARVRKKLQEIDQ